MGPSDKEVRQEEEREEGGREIPLKKEGSSKQASIQADSAYSSTYSSLNSINSSLKQLHGTTSPVEKCSFARFKKLSNKSNKSNSSSGQRHAATPQKEAKGSHAALDRSHEKTEHAEEGYKNQKSEARNSRLVFMGSEPETQRAFNISNSQESKALKVATLTQALGLVDRFKKHQSETVDKSTHESDLKNLASNLLEASQSAKDSSIDFHNLAKEDISVQESQSSQEIKAGEGFCVAVSLFDGLVMHTTNSLTSVLGYPKNMWVGRSFIDFIHADDRDTFTSQVTQNISLPLRSMSEVGKTYDNQEPKTTSGTFFCRIRAYNGLKHGFTIKERKTRYCPFKLVVCFSEVDKDASISSTKSPLGHQIIYMFITAIPITSAYTESFQEGPIKLNSGQGEFVSKHTSQGKFSWFDECAVSYTGHLPQNIIGADIFEFFHPADLMIIKEAFDVVMAEPGKPCKSKPFRFRINNGGYITITSWWSSFMNPWSKQLEFIHGKHVVTQGPKVTDIFNSREGSIEEIPASMTKQAEIIIPDIKRILSKTLVPSKTVPQNPVTQTSKNKKELASFMGSLLEEVAKAESYKLGQSSKALVMGNISPHYSDSSESPPSYNQLTYNENLTRFFNSQPQTLSENEANKIAKESCPYPYKDYDPVEGKPQVSKDTSSGEDTSKTIDSGSGGQHQEQGSGSGQGTGQNSSTLPTGLSAGQAQQGGDDGMCSQDGSGSGSRMGSGSRGSNEQYKGPPITVELMESHNKEMEQKMLHQFKEAKRTGEMRRIKDGRREVETPNQKSSVIQRHTSRSTPVPPPKQRIPKAPESADIKRKISEAQWMAQIQQQARQNATLGNMNRPGFIVTPNIKGQAADNQPGFPDQFLGVPTVYIPINQGQAPEHLPQGIMMQGANYVPLGMMYSVNPETKPTAGPSRTQPELPKCLAVDSCMVIGQPPDPASTVTKVDLKGKPAMEPKTNIRPSDEPSYSTSSSSLYSFLKTSSDAQTLHGSGDDEQALKAKQEKRIPILKEPFWNTRVDWNNDLKYRFTMQQTDLEEVLLADRKKLENLVQPTLVNEQLETLFDEFDEGVVLEEFLEDFQGPPTDEETENENENEPSKVDLEEKLLKDRRKANHLEKMNIFMEAEAPFPMPDSPSPNLSKKSASEPKSWHNFGDSGSDSENSN